MTTLRRVIAIALLSIALGTVIPNSLLACSGCKYSPNGWGFCRDSFAAGYIPGTCKDTVVDPWTGRTDCDFDSAFGSCNDVNGPSMPPGVADGGGGNDGGCYMTGLYGGCLIHY